MIAQIKMSQKTAQKAAVKRLIDRSVIMTVIELLLIILILSSCQKESEVVMKKTKTVVAYANISTNIGNFTDTETAIFYLSKEPKRLNIKSAHAGIVDFNNALQVQLKLYACLYNATNVSAGIGDFITGTISGNLPISESQVKFDNALTVNAGGDLGVKFILNYSGPMNVAENIQVCCVVEFEYEE